MPVTEMPKYEQVKRDLIREIELGRWSAGEAVPSETQLLQRFNVSRPTLVRSLQDLVREGYLYRRQGKGTYVAERQRAQAASEPLVQLSVPLFVSNYTAQLSGTAREVLLRIMHGAQSALADAHGSLTLRHVSEQTIDDETRRFLDASPPRAALVVEPSFNRQLFDELVARGWNVWGINEPIDYGNCVVIDHEHAGYLATKYLIQKGRQRIALLNGPLDAYWGFRARQAGYQRAMREAGLPIDPSIMLQGAHAVDSEAGRAMMRALLQQGSAIDAVVGASDSKTLGAQAAALEAGVPVPERVMFVSIDNIIAGQTDPPLPSVAMPFEELGRQAAARAMETIPSSPGTTAAFHTQIQLKPTLIER